MRCKTVRRLVQILFATLDSFSLKSRSPKTLQEKKMSQKAGRFLSEMLIQNAPELGGREGEIIWLPSINSKKDPLKCLYIYIFFYIYLYT